MHNGNSQFKIKDEAEHGPPLSNPNTMASWSTLTTTAMVTTPSIRYHGTDAAMDWLMACPLIRIGHNFHNPGRPGRPSASTHKDCMSCRTRPPDGAYTRWLSSAGILTSLVVGGKYVWCDVDDVDTRDFVQLVVEQGTSLPKGPRVWGIES